jgi:hypothetical protein
MPEKSGELPLTTPVNPPLDSDVMEDLFQEDLAPDVN